ncbi:DUF4440 domain-containing protein [Candidatus Marinamargulisbacteria bacterium SCGC AG-410-N11]|nr:DUF4440 domain-containing protein [Candidatus Marinamargulisbacteria bacterium SCGC AG-410-N11]
MIQNKVLSKQLVRDQFENWNKAIQTGDPDTVVKLYHEKGTLIPTLSNQVRYNHNEIKDYFVHFLAKKPKGEINESNIHIFEESKTASYVGLYTFEFGDGSKATCRFSYLYQFNDQGEGLILHHHSSLLPE